MLPVNDLKAKISQNLEVKATITDSVTIKTTIAGSGPPGPQGDPGPPGIQGEKGDPGTGGVGDDKNYIHYQLTPSSEWICDHNLGKMTSCTILDSTGMEVEADKEFVGLDQVKITSLYPFSGTAHFN